MCLVFFAYGHHPGFRVILAANRDEFYERPTAPMAYWADDPNVLAGMDLAAGGTWLGIHNSGRWAAVTNYREPAAHRNDAATRGELIRSFLTGRAAAMDYLDHVAAEAGNYNGFNLLVDDGRELGYLSSRMKRPSVLAPGIYGLSNHLLDTPWPKVSIGKRRFSQLMTSKTVSARSLLDMLADRSVPADKDLPDTGVGLEWERLLGPMFIVSAVYGTRCSTVLTIGNNGRVDVTERTYRTTEGTVSGNEDRRFRFQITGEDGK